MINRIVLVCPHALGGLARVTPMSGHVVIEYGSYDSGGVFLAQTRDHVFYTEHPEIAGIHVNDAWDVLKLAALVDTFCEDES